MFDSHSLPQSDSARSFQHDPLDIAAREIRVLSIGPDLSAGGLIQCTMRHIPLADTHTCLSYTWGKATGSKTILLNGEPFLVRRNLWHFLEATRYRYYTYPPKYCGCSTACRHLHSEAKQYFSDQLWIGAICINQNNVPEKNRQVQMMGEIYAKAEEVLAYVGQGHPAIDEVLHVIHQLVFHHFQTFPTHSIDRFRNMYGWDHEGQQQALKMLNLPYWTRAWVRQELFLARNVRMLYGTHQFRLEQFMKVVKQVAHDYSSAMSKVTIKNPHDQLHSLHKLVHGSWNLDSTEKKDRVFAMLSMANDGHSIPVDYSMSVLELYIRVLGLPPAAPEDGPPDALGCLSVGWQLGVGLGLAPEDLTSGKVRDMVRILGVQDWTRSITVAETEMITYSLIEDRRIIADSPRKTRTPDELRASNWVTEVQPAWQAGDIIFAAASSEYVEELFNLYFVGRPHETATGAFRIIAIGRVVESFKGFRDSKYQNRWIRPKKGGKVKRRLIFADISAEADITVRLHEPMIRPETPIDEDFQGFELCGDEPEDTRTFEERTFEEWRAIDLRDAGLEGKMELDILKTVAFARVVVGIYADYGQPFLYNYPGIVDGG